MPCWKGEGKMPVDREQFIMAKISGPTVWNTAFKNQVVMQVVDFESATCQSSNTQVNLKFTESRASVSYWQCRFLLSIRRMMPYWFRSLSCLSTFSIYILSSFQSVIQDPLWFHDPELLLSHQGISTSFLLQLREHTLTDSSNTLQTEGS